MGGRLDRRDTSWVGGAAIIKGIGNDYCIEISKVHMLYMLVVLL